MSTSSTVVHTHTITQTATHLADVILSSMADILASLGIDVTRFFADWNQDQRAILAWISERSLKCVILECHQPSGTVAPVFEFPVSYTGIGEADRKFSVDRASLARYLAKLQSVPKGTHYRLFCTFHGAHTSQAGWQPGDRASTDGMRSFSFGTLATGPHANASLLYFMK